MIAASAVGAAIGLARVADDVGLTVRVLGHAGRGVGDAGGKILMLERGAFDGVHAAMMVHPAPHRRRDAAPHRLADVRRALHRQGGACLGVPGARDQCRRRADGRADGDRPPAPAHPPHRSRPRHRHARRRRAEHRPGAHRGPLHGARATLEELEELRPSVHRCFEAGALATGATLEIVERQLALRRGRARRRDGGASTGGTPRRSAAASSTPARLSSAPPARPTWATSRAPIPSIHPLIGIDSLPAVNHQPEFAAHCVTAAADRAARRRRDRAGVDGDRHGDRRVAAGAASLRVPRSAELQLRGGCSWRS